MKPALTIKVSTKPIAGPSRSGTDRLRDQEDVDDRQPQQQQPRRPAETDEQNVGEERADGAAGIGGGLIEGIGTPARGIGGVVSAQAQAQEYDRQGEGDKGC